MPGSFAHLHVHTEYSMLDGAARLDDLFAEAARMGMPALAMTDHGQLFGAVDFYLAGQKHGVKPILGVEAYLLRASLLAVISQRLVRLTCTHCSEVEPVDAHVRDTLGVGHDEVFHRGRGCSHCEGLGVHKRQAVYELLVMTPRLRELVAPGAEADTLHRVAIEEGMRPITAAAIALARTGAISLAEAWRVRAD